MTFLEIIGLITLVGVAIVLGLVLFIAWRVRRFLRKARVAFEHVDHASMGPRQVHLDPEPHCDWQDGERVEIATRLLVARGFKRLGTYRIRELPGVHMLGLNNPGEGTMAAVYEMPHAGVVVDLLVRYADDRSLTVSDARFGSELDQRPGHRKLFHPTAGVDELHELILAEREAGPYNVWNADEWPHGVERDYAEAMSWRLARGGVTTDEVRRVAAAMPMHVSEEVMTLTQHAFATQAAGDVREACLESYRRQEGLPLAGWPELASRLGVLPANGAGAEVRELLEALLGEAVTRIGDDLDATLAVDAPVVELMLRANALLPADHRLVQVGEVDAPLAATIWRAP